MGRVWRVMRCCESDSRCRGGSWNAPAHGQHMQHDSATRTRAMRTATNAVGAHAVRLSSAVCEACSNLTVVAYCGLLCKEAAGGRCGRADPGHSRGRCGSHPDSNFWSNGCSYIYCRTGMWPRASVASTEAGMRERSELGRGASAGSAMGCTAQRRIVPAGHDASARVRTREGHTAAWTAWMHCC